LASNATVGSLVRAQTVDAGVENGVVPGRNPDVHDLPPFVEVANPMLAAPPSNMRPTWNAETMVEPKENVSGSTSVLCWLIALVYGSELICKRVVLAAAVDAKVTVSTTAPATALRRPTHRTGHMSLTLM
jgi:hypothetical protein